MNDLPEQTIIWTPTRRASRGSVSTSNKKHPAPTTEQDDGFYTTRLPSSVRRYDMAPSTSTQTHTVMRVTNHQGSSIQQTSLTQGPARQKPVRQVIRGRKTRGLKYHVVLYIGVGMIVMLVMVATFSRVGQWYKAQQDIAHYGYPRTFQCDANVKHGGVSHFTVENLNGHILIFEVQINDLSKTKIYTGPVLLGQDADLQPATISFEDVNGDGYPDMILLVNGQRYLLINDHKGFRQSTPADQINAKGV